MPTYEQGLHGAFLRSDLEQRLGRPALRKAVASGQLQPLWRGVLVERDRILDPRTRAAAALLTAGDEAVLTGRTAAMLHGCRAVSTVQTHILLPYWRKVRGRSGLVVHHGGFFASDVVERDGLRMLSINRVTADLLCGERSQDALALADEVLKLAGESCEVTRKEIAGHIRRRRDNRGTVRGEALLDLASPRAESTAESWVRMLLLEWGFPLPEVNHPILGVDGGEVYRLDLAWPQLRIAVEYDGYSAHAGREVQDDARYEDLRRRGWLVVRTSSPDLTDFGRAAAALRAAFERRGYTW
ncbi:hypothetical protein WEH80_40790 [Actinomycetes bacterium KLBMP 9759]